MSDAAKPRPSLGQFLRDDFRLFWQRFGRVRHWLRSRYLVADPRTLGLYRIVIGSLLFIDGIRHWTEARFYYSNEGVLTNHWHLFKPSSGANFSLFHAFSSPTEVHVAFALSMLCYLAFMVGYRTRLFTVLAFLWVTSMDNRLVMVENGGYVVVNLAVLWAMFLPTGQRFSVDSWLRSWRERGERSVGELSQPYRPAWLTAPRVSLASLLLLLNFGIVYVFNVLNKYGSVWRKGDTVHYVLHLDRMVTGLAIPLREHLPLWLIRGMSWSTLVLEAMIVMLIFWPHHRRITRPLAMVLALLLHTAFGLLMRLGPFSWFMIGWSTALLCTVHWEALTRWSRARTEPITLWLDPRCGTALAFGRIVKRLDRLERVRFRSAPDSAFMARLTMGWGDGASNDEELASAAKTTTGRALFWSVARVLPLVGLGAPLWRLLTLGAPGTLFVAIERYRDRLARFFGLSANEHSRQLGDGSVVEESSRCARGRGRVTRIGRELFLWYLLACATSQLINENKSIPKPLKHTQPKLVRGTIAYPRIFQGWGMFSPNPIQVDGSVTVDALTIDGRHIDPFTGREPDMNLSDARGLGLNQIEQDYFNRIRLDRNKVFLKPLREFLANYHLRTGRAEDELIAFDVYWLTDHCPKPGSTTPYDHDAIPFVSWRKPRYRRKAGMPKLPKKLKLRSAGK